MTAVTPAAPRRGPRRSAAGRWLTNQSAGFRRRLGATYASLALLNFGAWGWALASFHGRPILLGVALITYGLGLRHAIDADHIAAIDNVTRKLMQADRRPVGVGFFFALGHSSVVLAVTAVVASAANALKTIQAWQVIGGLISTAVSASFLITIAVMNLVIFAGLLARYRTLRRGQSCMPEDLDSFLANRGFLCRIAKPLFALVSHSWQMFGIGLLFGLGFDTATEVAVFGTSATQAAQGLPISMILIFPVLFAAGMALVDTTDGVLMLGAYDWALGQPRRRLRYNLAITAVSVAVALLIGGAEALNLAVRVFDLRGRAWIALSAFTNDMNLIGMLTIGLFAVSWLLSIALHRSDPLEAGEI